MISFQYKINLPTIPAKTEKIALFNAILVKKALKKFFNALFLMYSVLFFDDFILLIKLEIVAAVRAL